MTILVVRLGIAMMHWIWLANASSLVEILMRLRWIYYPWVLILIHWDETWRQMESILIYSMTWHLSLLGVQCHILEQGIKVLLRYHHHMLLMLVLQECWILLDGLGLSFVIRGRFLSFFWLRRLFILVHRLWREVLISIFSRLLLLTFNHFEKFVVRLAFSPLFWDQRVSPLLHLGINSTLLTLLVLISGSQDLIR
jgi:hypothetical protein